MAIHTNLRFPRKFLDLLRKGDFLVIVGDRSQELQVPLHGSPTGAVDQHLVQTVSNAVSAIPDGRTYRIRAILYVQGESDNDAEAPAGGGDL